MHPRNRHREYLDYRDLAKRQKGLRQHVYENAWGGASIDYADQEALQELTRSLLADFYSIHSWRIPAGYLCPPVPQRADYIHSLADLLQVPSGDPKGDGLIPARGPGVCGLDVGTGASCIYCLLGAREYGWSFIASDVDQSSLDNAKAILSENSLQEQVQLRLQKNTCRVLRGVLRKNESIAFVVCNPPFHESLDHATQAANSKWQRLGRCAEAGEKNYQGQATELCCEGGEVGFVMRMAEESARPRFREACIWFSALLSRASSVDPVRQRLGELGARRRGFELRQGRNVKWVIAWTFLGRSARQARLSAMIETPGSNPVAAEVASSSEVHDEDRKRKKQARII